MNAAALEGSDGGEVGGTMMGGFLEGAMVF